MTLSYAERSELSKHPITKKLLKIMEKKKTNLCVAADLCKSEDIINLVKKVGPFICVLKTHVDIVSDFSKEFIRELSILSVQYNFLIFEDRKFADIGNTVKQQYEGGIYHISSWAHIVNAHSLPGKGMIDAFKETCYKDVGLLLITDMSCSEFLSWTTYREETFRYGYNNKSVVMGFITSKTVVAKDPSFLYMTPGVHLKNETDGLGQQYRTPEEVIEENQSDIIIVGRGIYESQNVVESSKIYQERGWNSYLKQLK